MSIPRAASRAVASRGAAAVALACAATLAACNGGDKNLVSVVVALPDAVVPNAARATVVVDYSGSGSRIHNADGAPDCAFILPGVEGDFADDGRGTLTIHTSGERALRGPADVAACRMEAPQGTTASSLRDKIQVRVSEAEDASGKSIDIATATAKPRAARSEEAIQQAQADAVKTAASISAAAPPPAAPPPAPGTVPAGVPPPPGMGTVAPRPIPGGVAAPPVPGAPGAMIPKAPHSTGPAGATGPRNLAAGPGAASAVGAAAGPGANSAADGVQDDGAVGGGDRDPSYDDSDSDNPSVPAYTLTFMAQSGGGTGDARFGALQFEVNHLGRSGGFIGREDTIECVPLVDAIVAGNFVGERVAKFGLISLQGVRFGSLILNCGFRTREPISTNSFAIEVTDASDTNSNPIEPQPTVVLSGVTRR